MPVPTTDELQGFIDDPMAAKLETLDETVRRQRFRHRTVLAVLAIVFVPATAIITLVTGTDRLAQTFDFDALLTVPPAMFLIAAAIYGFVRYRFLSFDIPFEYKPDMVAPVVHYIDPRLRYRPDDEVPAEDFLKSGLAQTSVDAYGGEQTYRGSLRSIDLRFGALRARSTAGSGGRRRPVLDFDGLFLVADLPREFEGYTIVIASDDEEPAFSWDPQRHPKDLTAVDDTDLSDHFDVYSTAPEAARLLLSPEVLVRIEDLRHVAAAKRGDDAGPKTTPSLAFVFCDRRFYLARHRPAYFDRPPDLDPRDPAHLHQIGEELRIAIDLVECLGILPNS